MTIECGKIEAVVETPSLYMNITVLVSSHILDELSKLATTYGFIDKGKNDKRNQF